MYFRWCIAMHQRKVQGFCGKTAKILALEQRIIALKALACKGFALFSTHYLDLVASLWPIRMRKRRAMRAAPTLWTMDRAAMPWIFMRTMPLMRAMP